MPKIQLILKDEELTVNFQKQYEWNYQTKVSHLLDHHEHKFEKMLIPGK